MKNKVLHIALCLSLFVISLLIYVNRYFTELGTTFFTFFLSLALSLSILYFLREEIFTAWWRFARWYLIIPLAYIIIPQKHYSPWTADPFGDAESQIMFFAALFFIISLGIIVVKWLKLRGKP